MKKSFSLLETIIVLLLFSIIIYTVIYLTTIISYTNKDNYNNTVMKIDLESTRLFIKKHIKEHKMLSFKDHKLLYKDNLLLDDVESFSMKVYNTYLSYTICLKREKQFCQEYILRLNNE